MRADRRLILTAIFLAAFAGDALADGLYKGHGRRTIDYSWSFRANGSVGFHGVEDPWDQFGVSSYPVGGYTTFGMEFALGSHHSLELGGGYYWVNDSQGVVAIVGPPELPRPGNYSYEVDAWSAGLTYRFWIPRGGTSTFLALGGAWVVGSDLRYREQISGEIPYRISASGSGPQISIAFGYEGITHPNVRMGMELGLRYSWVDFDQGIYGAGNFNGIYLGFRLGLVKRP
jgi:hypothetical protein